MAKATGLESQLGPPCGPKCFGHLLHSQVEQQGGTGFAVEWLQLELAPFRMLALQTQNRCAKHWLPAKIISDRQSFWCPLVTLVSQQASFVSEVCQVQCIQEKESRAGCVIRIAH